MATLENRLELANYIIENKCSVREVAKEFGLGKSTVHDYIQKKLPDISIKHYKAVFDILMENKSFSTNNKKVVEQVLKSYDYLVLGKTIDEIKDIQGLGWNVVQRNLTTRLSKIDKEKYKSAKEILTNNQLLKLRENEFRSSRK